MSRARNIKPKFFANEELVELSFGVRLLFIGLWTIADREGRLEDRPKRIKMELFPADDFDIDGALNELQKSGFVLRYCHGEARYIQIFTFSKHQNPHRDEKASIIPAPCEHHTNTVQASCEYGCTPADSLIPDSLIPDSLIPDSLIPDSLFPDSLIPDSPNPDPQINHGADKPLDVEFEKAWADYPKRSGANKAGALKAWRARLKVGISSDAMLNGVKRYAQYCAATGKVGTEFVKQAATFFGPDKHFESDWTVPQQARASPHHEKFDPVAHVNRNRVKPS